MFKDQTVELLPARTTMTIQIAGGGSATSANVLNFGVLQANVANSFATGGSNVNVTKYFIFW